MQSSKIWFLGSAALTSLQYIMGPHSTYPRWSGKALDHCHFTFCRLVTYSHWASCFGAYTKAHSITIVVGGKMAKTMRNV
ncbi:hypothetical protein BDD12DRAFT_863483 [Trichophaea hybrida]|nr:hypothetical protein BDD12DRAFT_863483 [Trichophaea hybrida]